MVIQRHRLYHYLPVDFGYISAYNSNMPRTFVLCAGIPEVKHMERVILHADLNNFYASVECLYNPAAVPQIRRCKHLS